MGHIPPRARAQLDETTNRMPNVIELQSHADYPLHVVHSQKRANCGYSMAGIIAPRERESQQGASTQLIYTSDSRDAGHKAPISSGLSAWLKRPSQYG